MYCGKLGDFGFRGAFLGDLEMWGFWVSLGVVGCSGWFVGAFGGLRFSGFLGFFEVGLFLRWGFILGLGFFWVG